MMSRGFLVSLVGILAIAVWYGWKRQRQSSYDRRLMWLVYGGGLTLYLVVLLSSLRSYLAGESDALSLVMVAVLGFVIAGAVTGNLYELVLKQRMERMEVQRLKRRFPDSPWRWDRRWQGKGIVCSNNGDVIFGVILAGLINGGLITLYVARKEQIRERLYEDPWGNICIYYVFLMGGLFALRFAVNAVMAWKKYGLSTFEMTTVPGVIGGTLEGVLETRFKEVPHAGFDLSLSCIEMDVSFRQASNWIPEVLLWQAVKKIRIEDIRMGRRGISFPVSFTIPFGVEETDASSRSRRIMWVLRASAQVDTHTFSAAFRVPVFRVSGAVNADGGHQGPARTSGTRESDNPDMRQ